MDDFLKKVAKSYSVVEIKEGIKDKSISIGFSRYFNSQVAEKLLNKNYSRALKFYRYLSYFLMLTVPLVIFIGRHWIEAIGVFIFSFVISSANDRSAHQFVIEQIQEDDELLMNLIKNKVILLRQNEGQYWITKFNF